MTTYFVRVAGGGGGAVRAKRCSKCSVVKPLTSFTRDKSKRLGARPMCRLCAKSYNEEHREERRDYKKQYRAEHRKELAEYQRWYYEQHREELAKYKKLYNEDHREDCTQWHQKLRAQVFDHYGWSCQCCGTSENLSLDHIYGDGAAHRLELFGDAQHGWIRVLRLGNRQRVPGLPPDPLHAV